MLRLIVAYGMALAVGAFVLQWLDYKALTRSIAWELYVALIAAAFAAGGVWLGWRLAARARGPGFVRNAAALKSLKLTGQEVRVLEKLASGRSNKEIGRELGLSPNTVKTHLSNLFAKLDAGTRTEAVGRARELELIP